MGLFANLSSAKSGETQGNISLQNGVKKKFDDLGNNANKTIFS